MAWKQRHLSTPIAPNIRFWLTPAIYERLERGNPHGTWVIIHEYAHVALHGRLLQRLASMDIERRAALYKGTPTPHEFYMDTEWQTDSLTGAFLMPAAGIAQLEKVPPHKVLGYELRLEQSVSIHFGTSYEAAGYRVDTFRRRRNELLAA